jgi:hypothetical protein
MKRRYQLKRLIASESIAIFETTSLLAPELFEIKPWRVFEGLRGDFFTEMTESFRSSFLKLIYNNKKKELGWRSNPREF